MALLFVVFCFCVGGRAGETFETVGTDETPETFETVTGIGDG
jgi:hypothetical protein